MLLCFALIRKSNYVADVKSARRQFIADLQEFNNHDRGARDRLLLTLLAPLDSLGDRDLLLALEERDYPHFAHVDANGIRRFIQCSGRKIEFPVFLWSFIIFATRYGGG